MLCILNLGLLQFVTALFAGIIGLLFFKFAEGEVFDFIARFLPDVSLVGLSIVGLMMLLVQVFGNLIGGVVSFVGKESAGKIAILIGGTEALWMLFQFIMLHTHHILVLVFFLLSVAQVISGYWLSQRVKELHKVPY